MIIYCRHLPANPRNVRNTLYAGEIYQVQVLPAQRRLCAAVDEMVREEFGPDYLHIHERVELSQLKQSIRGLKDRVYRSTRILELTEQVIGEIGLDSDCYLDPPRLRVVLPDKPVGAWSHTPVYGAHRDTWYANSYSQINLWMPIHDTVSSQTFSFFPEYFAVPAENDSQKFDYETWKRTVGFGNSQFSDAGAYPLPTFGRPSAGSELHFHSECGEIVVFSAAHLHATNVNLSEQTRVSIDFRYVHAYDHKNGIGAPNVDSLATGDAVSDYVRLSVFSPR